jgi:hypothetical protein
LTKLWDSPEDWDTKESKFYLLRVSRIKKIMAARLVLQYLALRPLGLRLSIADSGI